LPADLQEVSAVLPVHVAGLDRKQYELTPQKSENNSPTCRARTWFASEPPLLALSGSGWKIVLE
jgi:hypothetical protein